RGSGARAGRAGAAVWRGRAARDPDANRQSDRGRCPRESTGEIDDTPRGRPPRIGLCGPRDWARNAQRGRRSGLTWPQRRPRLSGPRAQEPCGRGCCVAAKAAKKVSKTPSRSKPAVARVKPASNGRASSKKRPAAAKKPAEEDPEDAEQLRADAPSGERASSAKKGRAKPGSAPKTKTPKPAKAKREKDDDVDVDEDASDPDDLDDSEVIDATGEVLDDKPLPKSSSKAGDSRSLARVDALQMYMREVQRHPLLSPEEEHSLAVHYSKTGDVDAAAKLVTANLRLVVK